MGLVGFSGPTSPSGPMEFGGSTSFGWSVGFNGPYGHQNAGGPSRLDMLVGPAGLICYWSPP